MCSIAGYNLPERPALNRAWQGLMRHRGPDAEGSAVVDDWVLLHQRLSIIDLSPAANQPMELHGNWLIFNGEIYNYKELRTVHLADAQLKSVSDSEVLLHLLDRHGPAILNQLNGMFAFAWYNRAESALHLVRDRFGVKPLYWTPQGNGFAFASEIKPLLLLQERLRWDEEVIRTYLDSGVTDHNHRTFAENIFQVPPGHQVRLRNGHAETRRWYHGADAPPDPAALCSQADADARFEELLTDAVRLRLRSDVPVAITLSGGLDSTTIYVLAKEHLQARLQPFTLVRQGFLEDESNNARALATRYGDAAMPVSCPADLSWDEVMDSLRWLEFPVWNHSPAAYLKVYGAIQAAGCKVVLEGHGGDELLGGYPFHLRAAWQTLLARGELRAAFDMFRYWQNLYHPDMETRRPRRTPAWLRFLKTSLSDAQWLRRDQFEKSLRFGFERDTLPIILRNFDRLPMACSVESRSPFLDYRVVELASALPMSSKIGPEGSKAVLRRILRKYGCEALWRNKHKVPFIVNTAPFITAPDNRRRLADAICGNNLLNAKNKHRALQLLENPSPSLSSCLFLWRAAAVPLIQQQYADWLSQAAIN